jgi:two-component system, NtrC family, sensor kinase
MGRVLPYLLFLAAGAACVACVACLVSNRSLRKARAMNETLSLAVRIFLNNRSRVAFREALAVIAKAFGVCVAILVLNHDDGGATAFDQDGKEEELSPQKRVSLDDLIGDPVWRAGERRFVLPLAGYDAMFVVSAPLQTIGVGLGHLFIARSSAAFSRHDPARIRITAMAEVLAPVLVSRSFHSIEESKRKAAERELDESVRLNNAFIENSPDMVYRCDLEDRFVSINPAGLAFLGKKKPQDCLGRLYSDFALNESDRVAILTRIRDEGVVHDFEIVLKREDGKTFFCTESSQACSDSAGKLCGVQGIVRNIEDQIESGRKQWKLTMELAEANVEIKRTRDLVLAQEKLASIGQLAAGVAHEINNPLGFLKSNHEMSADYTRRLVEAWGALSSVHPDEAEPISKRLDIAFAIQSIEQMKEESKDGIDRIVKIVTNLKTFARKDSESPKAPYDLNAGVESTLVMAANEIKYVANVEKLLGAIPPIIANGNEINQVLLNILVNAGQAIAEQKRERKGLIVITTRQKGSGVECVIADDGPGMTPEVKKNIFEPFYTTKESGKGTGLGLSISNDIVAGKHGGNLSVESEPGKGAAFKIFLPCEPSE